MRWKPLLLAHSFAIASIVLSELSALVTEILLSINKNSEHGSVVLAIGLG